jgi:hypothetical protein
VNAHTTGLGGASGGMGLAVKVRTLIHKPRTMWPETPRLQKPVAARFDRLRS